MSGDRSSSSGEVGAVRRFARWVHGLSGGRSGLGPSCRQAPGRPARVERPGLASFFPGASEPPAACGLGSFFRGVSGPGHWVRFSPGRGPSITSGELPGKIPATARTSPGGPGSVGARRTTTTGPDGQATGRRPVQVGSTPTGVSRGDPTVAARTSSKRPTSPGQRRGGLALRRSARRVP